MQKCYVCKSKNPRICFPSDNTMLRSMTAAAYQTQELVYGDECPEPPPNTSIPVPGHDVDISGPFFRTTEIYSWIGSVSFSEPQSMRSVSGYHSLSVSRSLEVEGATADQGQPATTSPGLWDSVSASCVTNQSLNPQMDPANQMPGSFSGGGSDISIRASTVTRVLHLVAALELQCS